MDRLNDNKSNGINNVGYVRNVNSDNNDDDNDDDVNRMNDRRNSTDITTDNKLNCNDGANGIGSDDKRTFRNTEFTKALCENLNRLRKEKKFCDWILKTEDGLELHVHKVVLVSTSSYFEGLLNSGMLECSQNFLIIKKITGKCLQLIIEYIYTGEICITEQTVEEILEYAMYFGLLNLIDICSEFLCEYINNENALQLWRYSETFSGNLLKQKCVEHILENGEEIFKPSTSISIPIKGFGTESMASTSASSSSFASSDNNVMTTIKSSSTKEFPTTSTTPTTATPTVPTSLYLLDDLTYDEMKTLAFYKRSGLLDRMMYCPIVKWIMLDLYNRKKYINTFFNQIQIQQLTDELYGSNILKHNITLDSNDFLSKIIQHLNNQMLLKNETELATPSSSAAAAAGSGSESSNGLQAMNTADHHEISSENNSDQHDCSSSLSLAAKEIKENDNGQNEDQLISAESGEIETTNTLTVTNENNTTSSTATTHTCLFDNEFIAICNCDKIWYSNLNNDCTDGIYLSKILEISEFESHYACTKFLNNDLLLCGGINLNDKGPCSLCKYYSTENMEWKNLPSMKETRFMHSTILCNNNVYALGGFNNQTIEIFDIGKEEWYYGPSLKRREDNYDICTMLLNNNCIYAIGGRGRSFQYLDIRNNNWIELPISLDVCMHPFSPSIAFNNFIFYLSNNKVKAFEIRTNNWLDTDYTYKTGNTLSQFRVLLMNNNKIILADSPLNLGTILIDINNICNISISNFVTLSLNKNYCGLFSI